MRSPFAAINPARLTSKFTAVSRTRLEALGITQPATYLEVPAGWPNRATRRAVKQGRHSRLSGEWRQVLAAHPVLRQHIAQL